MQWEEFVKSAEADYIAETHQYALIARQGNEMKEKNCAEEKRKKISQHQTSPAIDRPDLLLDIGMKINTLDELDRIAAEILARKGHELPNTEKD